MMAAHALKVEPKMPAERGRAVRACEALVLGHTSLVRQIAFRLLRRMPPHVEVDDLIQAGMVGLLEAADRYAPGKGAAFRTYAALRIRGAILDSVRKSDWTPRSLHRRLRDIEKVKRRLENQASTLPTSAEVASTLGISVKDYHDTLQHAVMSRLVSLDEKDSADGRALHDKLIGGSADPADEMEQDSFRHVVAAAIDALPEQERLIVLLYYDAELLLREIGEQFDLSESRVCQIHKRAIERLRTVAQSWMRAAGASAGTRIGVGYFPKPSGASANSTVSRSRSIPFLASDSASIRRRGTRPASRIQEINQLLQVDPIADI